MPLRFRRPRPGVDQVPTPNTDIEHNATEVPATATVTDVHSAASDGPQQLPDRTQGGTSKERTSHEKRQVNWIRTEEESRFLQSLFTSDYEASKARNPDRVPGTCQWFLQSEKYKKWKENHSSDLLWVTADPGCGKSVLSKSIIANELQNTSSSTTCYFFFKDDSVDQRSITKAICALLHQYLCARKSPILLQKATGVFRAHGPGMMESFHVLWSLLLEIAQDTAAGQIICVLDALDECGENGREIIIDSLNMFSESAGTIGQLKFLITSRPYYHIEESFDHKTIRLAGEDESEAIQQEIDLVIKDRVPRVSKQLRLDPVTQNILQQRLLDTENRTYLWLHLILEDIVKRSLKVKTARKMERFLQMLPVTVYDAYERILDQSEDRDDARRLLQIVLAAQRPLSLEEINIALHIQEDNKAIGEVDLIPEYGVQTYVKNLCGLFVTIYDSKVYFLHQTAREFLLAHESSSGNATTSQHRGIWKHSFQLETCHYVMARVCMTYLLFNVFEDEPPLLFEDWVAEEADEEEEDEGTEEGKSNRGNDDDERDEYDRKPISETRKGVMATYKERNVLFWYASSFWALHFEKCRAHEGLSEKWLGICDTGSRRFRTWFESYWKVQESEVVSFGYSKVPLQLNGLMVASAFGHDAMVEQSFEEKILENGDNWSRTALWWAVRQRRCSTVQLLLNRDANQSGDRNGKTPLMVAASEGFDELLAPLIDAGASLEDVDHIGRSALVLAVSARHLKSVEILISKGAPIDSGTTWGLPLDIACGQGHLKIVRLLLAHGAPVDGAMGALDSPLRTAAEQGHEEIANLLIDEGATLELSDRFGRTALALAARSGRSEMTKLLLEKGAEIETKDGDGSTPLSLAAGTEYDGVVAVLLKAHATIDTKDRLGRTPLMLAAERGLEEVVTLLLKNDAQVNLKDGEGRAALCYAAHGTYDLVKQLCVGFRQVSPKHSKTLEEFIEIPAETPLESAVRSGHATLVDHLLKLKFERKPLQVARQGLTSLREQHIEELHWHGFMAQRETMRLLVQHGADTETKDCEGCKSLLLRMGQDHSLVLRGVAFSSFFLQR